MSLEVCPDCGRPVEIFEIGRGSRALRQSQVIECPYEGCSGYFVYKAAGQLRVYALSEQQITARSVGQPIRKTSCWHRFQDT